MEFGLYGARGGPAVGVRTGNGRNARRRSESYSSTVIMCLGLSVQRVFIFRLSLPRDTLGHATAFVNGITPGSDPMCARMKTGVIYEALCGTACRPFSSTVLLFTARCEVSQSTSRHLKWPEVLTNKEAHCKVPETIVVINVRKKIKNVKNAFFILKIKNVCKRDKKRYPLFYLLLM